MKHKVQSLAKLTLITGLLISLTGCASLRSKTLKAPCGPTAGMTDPCGNRVPINQPDMMKPLQNEIAVRTEQV